MSSSIVVDGLSFAWPDGTVVLHDLDRTVATLSGGEVVTVGLAALFLRGPDVLLLDEPTDNLDMASVRQLAQALEAYWGALVVAGHDLPFLESIGITRWLSVDREGALSEIADSRALFDAQ